MTARSRTARTFPLEKGKRVFPLSIGASRELLGNLVVKVSIGERRRCGDIDRVVRLGVP